MFLKNCKNSKFKKIIFISESLLFLLIFLITQNLYSEDIGFKYFKNYSYEEYDHQPQNWGMAQAKNGIIYVANHGGVLEFDGVSWRVIYEDIPNYTIRSIDIDETGTIYIGGVGEIGYLTPDEKGVLKYNSLRSYLPKNQRDFSAVYKTYASEKGVYFQTPKFLFRWDTKQMKVWESKERFYFSFICEGKLFIRQKNVGLMQMDNDSLEKVPGGEMFTTRSVYMMVPYDSKKVLIGTRANGFYIYNGTTIRPFPTRVDDYLKKNLLYYGIRLTSGDFALATLRGGLVIMDPHGALKNIFDKSYGLQDDTVYYVFEDYQGNLWLCLSKGISKIEYVSPISLYDDRSNLSGLVLSLVRHHNNLYVGTSTGLYYLESSSRFRLITGISPSCWSLNSIKDSLLAATDEGVSQIDTKNNMKRRILEESSYVLLSSKYYPDRIWCGTHLGLVALHQENDRWQEEHHFKTISQAIRSIAEDKKGNVWLGMLKGGVLKIDSPINIDNPSVTRYDPSEASHSLPGGEVYVTVAADHIMFATTKGLYRFDEKNEKFIPDKTLGDKFAGGPDSKPVFRIAEDKNKNIWFHSESRNYQAIPESGKFFKINSIPFLRIPTTFQVNVIYPDLDGETVWFATYGGLIRYDTTVEKNYLQYFQTLVRRVLANERLIFDGCKNKTSKASKELFPVLEYKDRNLRFEFAAPFFEAETKTQYQCFMEGYDDNWSAWNKEGKSDYANIDSGLYTFRVRAKNIYGHTSSEDIFRFKVLPPWYKTWWAFSFYVLLAFLVIYFVVKWRSWKLIREKQTLEKIVKERTMEIREKNLQLQEQSQKLAEMDTVKSRFFANISHEFRTPLTLIMSPLEEMLSESQDKKQKKKINLMLRYSRQLLRYINQLLDLSRFDSGKMRLKVTFQNIVPFLKGTLASFHILAQHQKLKLELRSEEKDISLYFDSGKMEEVMYNLLINAIKFTPPEGKITVSISTVQRGSIEKGCYPKEERSYPDKGFVEISIRDTGVGIPKEQLDQIFDRFYQAKNYKEKDHRGTGIGLALTREIVNLHHGKIDVHSQEGKGTEFVIRLPMGYEHLEQDEIVADSETAPYHQEPKQIGEFDMITEDEVEMDAGEVDEGVEIEKYAVNGDKTEPQEKNVVLVVEDHRDMRKHIRSPLEPLYTVVEASDGKEGITKAKEIIPDLIVSDIMMPKKDGYELCHELKNDIKTSHIPIILLTAKASEESIIQGLETGADDYITKPFNSKMLITRIRNLIELRRQLQLKIQRQKMLLPDVIEVSSMDEKFLKEFQNIIEVNLSDPDFNVDILCKRLYMGRSTLFTKVKALTGETPNQFILSYRLERAAQLLKEKFGSVTEVAYSAGFSSPVYFSKCFKEKFHQSPSSYLASESKSS